MGDQSEDFANQLGRYLFRAGFTQQELANKIGMHRNTIVKWMNRTSGLSLRRGQVLQVADELHLTKQERKTLIQAAGLSLERWPTEIWTVPQQRDMFFTGRDAVFQSLRELLVPGNTTALTQAVSGLGGIGKTHIAVEYAYRFHQNYEAVLWLQADSWEVLVSACMKLAEELELPEQKETEQIIAELQRWLQKHRHWLLILDNVENPQEILPKFVLTGHQGSILVTTRVHDVEPLAQTQVLSTMPEQEGVLFLLRRTKKIASAVGLEQTNSVQREEARQIWQLMDGLPLALDQAGAYILETACSFSAYREQYNRRRAELLYQRGKRFVGHEKSVATTFSLAFERVEALNPVAADTLRACSLLHNEAIPEEIFQEGAEHLGPHLAAEKEKWDEAIGVLQEYSLMQRNPTENLLSIHSLVQAVLKDAMDEPMYRLWAERTVHAMAAVLPGVNHLTQGRYVRCIVHAQGCVQYIIQLQLTSTAAIDLLILTGLYFAHHARYAEAEPLWQQTLRILELRSGLKESWRERHDVALMLTNLATLYSKQGKYAQAEPLYQRALHILEEEFDPESSELADTLTRLAALYQAQGKYYQAEPLYRQALHNVAQDFGAEDPRVADPLTGLATLYKEKGEHARAERYYQEALRLLEQGAGHEYPGLADSLTHLAALYQAQDKYAQAEPLYQRALHILEQALGSEYHLTRATVKSYASLLRAMGREAEANHLEARFFSSS